MATEKKPLVLIGVSHHIGSPSYQATLNWIEEHVKPGMKIGLESIPGPSDHNSAYDFFRGVVDKIRSKGADVVPIDSEAGNRRARVLDNEFYLFATSSSLPDSHLDRHKQLDDFRQLISQKQEVIAILRTKHMLQTSLDHGVDAAIMGGGHVSHAEEFAMHLKPQVTYLESNPGRWNWLYETSKAQNPERFNQIRETLMKSFKRIRT